MEFKYFKNFVICGFIGAVLAFWIGYYFTDTVDGALKTLFIAAVLSILEISLSFDNAIVDATILKQMTPLWRNRFQTWGIFKNRA